MARLASVVGWNGGGGGGWRERRARQRLRRRQYCGGTVWLGRRPRRRAVAVSRLVRWRLLVALPQLSFPFVGTLALPAAVA
uniref:Uncharacterized protein n=1 Tax=Leersia perrieri TaxID=77586 RepID=A0A0D9WAN8_9ORYZ